MNGPRHEVVYAQRVVAVGDGGQSFTQLCVEVDGVHSSASCGPLRGAMEARANNDDASPSSASISMPHTTNQGNPHSMSSGHRDLAGVHRDAKKPGDAVKDVELTEDKIDKLEVHKNPLWGRF